MLQAGMGVRNMEVRLRKRSGELADALASADVLELGGEVCTLASVMDITDRKAAERQLRESERRFRDFAEAAGEYVWELDVDGRYTYVSRRVEQVLGYAPDELLGRKPMELMPPGEAERSATGSPRSCARGRHSGTSSTARRAARAARCGSS
jgi:PAS domain S-box-containing protein